MNFFALKFSYKTHKSTTENTAYLEGTIPKGIFGREKKTMRDGKYFPVSLNILPKPPSPVSIGLNGCNYFKLITNKTMILIFKRKFNTIHLIPCYASEFVQPG